MLNERCYRVDSWGLCGLAVQNGCLVHIAGQIALDPGTLTVPNASASTQAKAALAHVQVCGTSGGQAWEPTNLTHCVAPMAQSIAESMGGDIRNAVAVTCYLTHPSYLQDAQQVLREGGVAAPTAYVVIPALPRGARVEWELLLHSHPVPGMMGCVSGFGFDLVNSTYVLTYGTAVREIGPCTLAASDATGLHVLCTLVGMHMMRVGYRGVPVRRDRSSSNRGCVRRGW